MARHEADREDLMREATALVRRVEFRVPGVEEPVVAGWRATGWLSVYFGSDPVYHFDAEGRLRRAFVAGELYRSQGMTLARLRRGRTTDATLLERSDLSAGELAAFVGDAARRLTRLRDSLGRGEAVVTRQVPDEGSLTEALRGAVERILESGVGLAPAIKGKR